MPVVMMLPPRPLVRRGFARRQPCETPEAYRAREAAVLPDLAQQRRGRQGLDVAQAAQPLDSPGPTRRIQARRRSAQVLLSRCTWSWREQELGEARRGPHDVLREALPRKVAVGLILRRRDADAGEFPDAQQAGELCERRAGRPSPAPARTGMRPGVMDRALDAGRPECPLQAVSGVSRLVADPHVLGSFQCPGACGPPRQCWRADPPGAWAPGRRSPTLMLFWWTSRPTNVMGAIPGEHGRCPLHLAIPARQRDQSTRLRRRRPLHTH